MKGLGIQDLPQKRSYPFPEGPPQQGHQRADEEQGRKAEGRGHEQPFRPPRPDAIPLRIGRGRNAGAQPRAALWRRPNQSIRKSMPKEIVSSTIETALAPREFWDSISPKM